MDLSHREFSCSEIEIIKQYEKMVLGNRISLTRRGMASDIPRSRRTGTHTKIGLSPHKEPGAGLKIT
jgi:hypothetical protein